LSFKFRKLLRWLGGDTNEIQRLVIEALRVRDLIEPDKIEEDKEPVTFERRALPTEAKSFWALAEFYKLADNNNLPTNFVQAVNYVVDRKIDCKKYDFYWTPEVEHKLAHRVIVPFKYKNEIVGYTARAVNDGIKPKYHSNHPADFVFNLDNQRPDNKFVIVCEGTFDAMSVDGVSVQTNAISEQQAELIEQLGKPVIFVPDFDRHVNKQGREVWPGYAAVEQAIEYGWSVSFPIWSETCKDINSAVQKYGKLFVLKAIIDAQQSNPLKIKLMKNK
jgi:DNA primase